MRDFVTRESVSRQSICDNGLRDTVSCVKLVVLAYVSFCVRNPGGRTYHIYVPRIAAYVTFPLDWKASIQVAVEERLFDQKS